MYTNSITTGALQTVNAQSSSASPAKTAGDHEMDAATQTTNQDTYAPSNDIESAGTYSMDISTVKQMKAELEQVKLRFLDTVKRSLGIQISYGQGAYKGLTPEVQAGAQDAISEDGYWGVKQTSERIVTFGKALVGGDPSRVEEMRDAFIKGYEAVAKAWSSALPEISQQTFDAVMKLFDEWAANSSDEVESGEMEADIEAQPERSEEAVESEASEEDSAAQSGESGKVTFNEAKRARQLASVKTPDEMRALMSMLDQDLSDCKAGLKKGWCDEAEVAKVEAMIRQAKSRMSQLSDGEEISAGIDAFALNSLM